MAKFKCCVLTHEGQRLEEEFSADTKSDLIRTFQARQYRVISIEEVGNKASILSSLGIGRGPKKVNLKSRILFCRQLATLLRAGLPITQAFDIISSQTDDKFFKSILEAISADIQAGMVLSAAIQRRGEVFPPMLSKMVEIGEATGDMSKVMERLATQYESESRIQQKVKGALSYPIAVLVIAIGVCIFMLVGIVPSFIEVFDSLGSELPMITQVLLAMSDFLVEKWYIAIIVLPAAIFAIIFFMRTDKMVRWTDKKLLTWGFIKNPMQKVISASFARTLHTLISSGIPIVQSLEYTNDNIGNTVVKDAINDIVIGVRKGKGISVQMAEYDCFPKMLVSMLTIGESSGNMEEMLEKTADYYDEELDAAIAQILTLIEPLMMVFLAGIVGFVVIAMYVPMFEMISAYSNY